MMNLKFDVVICHRHILKYFALTPYRYATGISLRNYEDMPVAYRYNLYSFTASTNAFA